ncbi:MAG: hypothetical protein CSB48_00040 [Proteobacteria bacterium]|nr:MAG: hypothetical protein CSB48_00040 [Pseudomonadota bacterium]
MKYIIEQELSPHALEILGHLPDIKDATAREMLHQLMVYLLNSSNMEDTDGFLESAEALPKPVRGELMTFAEKLEARGEARGKAEGRIEGKIEGKAVSLEKLITLKFGECPEATRQRLKKATDSELDHWLEQILTANSVETLFQ